MTRGVELIYDTDCPNVEKARAALLQAFAEVRIPASWVEWDRSSEESPSHARQYGSPTILVDGRDVVGGAQTGGNSCRVYAGDNGDFAGVPSVEKIVATLRNRESSAHQSSGGRFYRSLAILPGALASLLPAGVCPACWPAYAGLLSSLGLGFLLNNAFLLPITIGFLALALLSFGYRAPSRHGFGPLVLGTVCTGAILVGKFVLSSDFMTYLGLGFFIVASLWNSWPQKPVSFGSCGMCAPKSPNANQRTEGITP